MTYKRYLISSLANKFKKISFKDAGKMAITK